MSSLRRRRFAQEATLNFMDGSPNTQTGPDAFCASDAAKKDGAGADAHTSGVGCATHSVTAPAPTSGEDFSGRVKRGDVAADVLNDGRFR